MIPVASHQASSFRNGFSKRQRAMQRTTKLNVAICRSSVRNVLWIARPPRPVHPTSISCSPVANEKYGHGPMRVGALAVGGNAGQYQKENRTQIKWICSSESCGWAEARALNSDVSVQRKNPRVADRREPCERTNRSVCTITCDRLVPWPLRATKPSITARRPLLLTCL